MNRVTRSLTNHLLSIVALSAVSYMVVAMLIITSLGMATRHKQQDVFKSKLALTVSNTAAIALFANNQQIADEVLDAILLHEEMEGARIVSTKGTSYERCKDENKVDHFWDNSFSFDLYSPIDDSVIGYIQLHDNDDFIRQKTIDDIAYQISFLLIQWLVVFVVIVFVVKRVIGQPLTELASNLLSVRPGNEHKIELEKKHSSDEIGLVTRSINQFVESTNSALRREKALRVKIEEMEQHYRHIAQVDSLTQLRNRLGCELTMAQVSSSYIGLLLIDLDGFKSVNDHFGHAAGDTVLVKLALRFKQSLEGLGTVGRVGGDEFIVIVPLESEDNELLEGIAAELIRSACEKVTLSCKRQVQLGASIGISISSMEHRSLEHLMHEADLAMYHVKENGKNHYCFYSTLVARASNI
ncbi:diguanylate cyclase [Vibrio sp. ZSDE26]|uniref:Diguanylate cyclase n=1 Tax=Vibrio amylolyticus TaxID=2847292 RepID=A0A9X1XKS3_9VIBR|nr:GGDEF domain-containing protein [Vibrio amylolyticus]MCK6264767.1 diguanylate cyclase [Vibrio amylolyticus]